MSAGSYPALSKYATAKIAVWWDMNDCPIPEGYDARGVRPNIEVAFKKLGYSGPVSITAYGGLKRTPYHLLRGLSSTGVGLVHTISESLCGDMYTDMLEWRRRNPPPATMMLISDLHEKIFSWELARLQQETKYNFFLAYKFGSPFMSSLFASAEWFWESLLAGHVLQPHNFSTVSETRHVLQPCSSGGAGESTTGMFYCKLCSFDGHRLENLRKHLWSTKHELEEGKNLSNLGIFSDLGVIDYVSVTRKWARNYPAKPEYATAKIAVFWDMNGCPVPENYDATRVRPSIERAFKKLGYTGPVSITAYGDQTQTSDDILRGLSSTGVNVAHTCSVVHCNRILSGMLGWQSHNPPPATMMVISNQVAFFSRNLVRLQQPMKYNLFLAYSFRPYQMPILLTSAEWLWESLLAVSETRHLLQKCSSGGVGESTGMFYCRSCSFDWKRLKGFRTHLSRKEHALEEGIILSRIRHPQNQQEQWAEESILERVRSSKYKREKRLEASFSQ